MQMIKFLKITFAIPFLISLNINAQNYQRIINWDYQQNGEKVQYSQTSEYLFFPKAVYDDHETMIPSYFELFPISSTVININQIKVSINNPIYIKLSEQEKKKIKGRSYAYSKPYKRLCFSSIRRR